MKKVVSVIACIFFVNGCGIAQYYNVDKVYKNAKESDFGAPPSEEDIKKAEETIRFSLIDPDSAKFVWGKPYRCVYPVDSGAFPGWCIYVNINAKNRFGGYTGYNKGQTWWKNDHLVSYVHDTADMERSRAF